MIRVPSPAVAQIQGQAIGSVDKMRPSQVQHTEVSLRGANASFRKRVWYGECQKNHAASIGGYAVDGCGEFMASGEEGTAAALKCAACNCHRSFNRREVENETLCDCHGTGR